MEYSAGIYCGHGKSTDGSFDPGCTYDGMTEASLMLPITKAFVKYARYSGITVYTDVDDGENNNMNAIKQVSEANSKKVDVFISIHCDWYKAPTGTLPLYCKDSEKGKKLAQSLNKYVKSYTGIKTRGVTARTDLYELNQTDAPACIFETGSIKADRKEWDTAKECDDYGKALAKGLCDYFGITFKESKTTTPTKAPAKTTTKAKYKTSKYAKKIKTYLKATGYYKGEIDSYVTPEYTKAVKTIQNKYFTRESDRDGIGGADTLKLAQNIYNMRDIKHFKLAEFKCNCGHCTGYPAVMNRQLLKNLDDLRTKFGSITITSGLRCKWKNSRLSGSSSTSLHMIGRAVDFYNRVLTSTKARRNSMIKRWYTYKKARYAYANTPGMGNAVHVDVKA